MDIRRYAGPPPLAIFLLALVILLLHITAYGITFHEARALEDARRLLGWLGGTASTEATWFGAERPSPAKTLMALGLVLVRGDTLFAIRFFPALLYAAAVAAVYAGLRRPRGPVPALAAASALLLAPPFFALSIQASNESVLTSLTLLALMRVSSARTPKEWGIAGLCAGLALGTKITGLLVGVTALAWLLRTGPDRARRAGAFLLALAIGFWLTWPVLPLRPLAPFTHVRHFAGPRPPVLFFGVGDVAPWYYAPIWLAIGLPFVIPALALFALLRGGFFRRPASPLARLLLVYTASALLAAIGAHAYLREGLRHLLPLAAVLAVAAALPLGPRAHLDWRSGGILLGLWLLLVTLSPHRGYPNDGYFLNELVGGGAGAARRGLPVTSSGDVMNDALLRRLPPGRYLVLPGAFLDVPLDFAGPSWCAFVAERVRAVAGTTLTLSREEAGPDYLLFLGAGPAVSPNQVTLLGDRRSQLVTIAPNRR